MRRTLGALLLSVALAVPVLVGCADDGSDLEAEDRPSPTTRPSDWASSSPPGPTPGQAVDFTEVALLSLTAGGGKVEYRATVLGDTRAAKRFAAEFRHEALGNQLAAAMSKADLPRDQKLAAAVVSIGCDVPPGVTVQKLEDGVAIVPREVPSPLPECLAPVTTVALVAVDESAL
jgi:hypothetical protein